MIFVPTAALTVSNGNRALHNYHPSARIDALVMQSLRVCVRACVCVRARARARVCVCVCVSACACVW
jgi:hypothetical protein